MTRNCLRCNDEFQVAAPNQYHCFRCAREVAQIIDLDTRRRTRFARVKDLTERAVA